jgi:hypothetical protein
MSLPERLSTLSTAGWLTKKTRRTPARRQAAEHRVVSGKGQEASDETASMCSDASPTSHFQHGQVAQRDGFELLDLAAVHEQLPPPDVFQLEASIGVQGEVGLPTRVRDRAGAKGWGKGAQSALCRKKHPIRGCHRPLPLPFLTCARPCSRRAPAPGPHPPAPWTLSPAPAAPPPSARGSGPYGPRGRPAPPGCPGLARSRRRRAPLGPSPESRRGRTMGRELREGVKGGSRSEERRRERRRGREQPKVRSGPSRPPPTSAAL